METKLGHLMERNVLEVFGERDAARRKLVIEELYAENCTFNDMDSNDPSVGRVALNAKVEHLLKGTPGFVFRLVAPAQVIQDLGRLRWEFGPAGAAPVVTGMDVAIFENHRIRSLYAFLDKLRD